MSLRDSPNIRINVELNTLSPKLFSVRVPAQRVAASGTNKPGMLTRQLPRLSRLSRQLSTSAHTWQSILTEAEAQVLKFDAAEKTERSFGIRHFVRADVLAHDSLASALSTTVGDKLAANSASDHVDYKSILMSAFESKPDICDAVAADIERFKVIDRPIDR